MSVVFKYGKETSLSLNPCKFVLSLDFMHDMVQYEGGVSSFSCANLVIRDTPAGPGYVDCIVPGEVSARNRVSF
jgi:hypothetical protein